jgi:hypothetical protein
MEIGIQVGELELQLLLAYTHTSPEPVPKWTVITFVPCPEVMVAPAGTFQLYVVAPLTRGIK